MQSRRCISRSHSGGRVETELLDRDVVDAVEVVAGQLRPGSGRDPVAAAGGRAKTSVLEEAAIRELATIGRDRLAGVAGTHRVDRDAN